MSTADDQATFRELRQILIRLDLAPDRKGHDKKCWWCAECGDDLTKALKLLGITRPITRQN